jgi:hypothetical protein
MSWFKDFCQGISNEVADATGAMYATGTTLTTGSPTLGAVVGEVISTTVDDGWRNGVCIAPGTISDAFSGGSSTQIDPAPTDMGAQPD